MSIVAGLQVPVTPLFEVVDNAGTVAPAQIVRLVPKEKLGIRLGLIVTVNVVFTAHCPGSGSKV